MGNRLFAAVRTATVCLLCLAVVGPTIVGATEPGERDAAWREDIDYLVERLHVMHPNIYAYSSVDEFDGAVSDLKDRVPRMTDNEIVIGIHELLALARDAHTGAVLWRMGNCAITDAWTAYPFTFYRFADGLYVLSASEEHSDLVGMRVVRFGDIDPKDAVRRVSRLVGADNEQGRMTWGCVYLIVAEVLEHYGIAPEKGRLTLRLADGEGREIERTLDAMPFTDALAGFYQIGRPAEGKAVMNGDAEAPPPLYLSRPGDAYWFEYLPEHDAMYVCLLSMENKPEEDFETFYARMFRELDERGARKIILDVRNNGGGDHYEMPLLKGVLARPHLDDRTRLFVITGRQVVSASQHFVTQFSLYTNATFVGEPTAAKPNFYGAQRFFNLPNCGLPVRSSVIFHQDATGWEMVGTSQPDYDVALSGADFANNRDPVLDMVLDFDRYANLPAELETAMAEAYEAGGIAAMEDVYEEFISEHLCLNEHMFLDGFTWWIFANRKTIEDYGEFLEMRTRRCPDSSGAWYALGMRRKIAGDPDAALHCLERAIETYPGNVPAKTERDLILFERRWAER